MNRNFSSVDNVFVTIYYAAIYLTPANFRGAARVISDFRFRVSDFRFQISDCLRAMTGRVRQTALILCAVMFVSAPGRGQTAPDAQSAIGAALPQDVIVLRREGNEALYNMDY